MSGDLLPGGLPDSLPLAPLQSDAGRELVLITGISGSGKSVALHALEDAGYFCVDNLPPELLRQYMALDHPRYTQRVAIAVDARAARSLPGLVPLIDELRGEGVVIRPMFLDASTDTLVRRFSETRRPHPLTHPASGGAQHALIEAIELERLMLAELREVSTVIDTSMLRPAGLREQVRQLVAARTDRLTLVFESFAFKYGVPLDADYVFDVRVLPNPYYVRELRPLSGRDAPVAEYLAQQPESADMLAMIEAFVRRWLPALALDQRGYVTVAIGCTGGQHRSVYIVEQLGQRFADHGATLIRHRELDAID
ncbi:MAG: RNase adaptor protein RapZ [Burkholderiales bacterium PBB5]|nr:MAG: RNase adaptor protein RapZ [Burkholderiales bacterium PBB5]